MVFASQRDQRKQHGRIEKRQVVVCNNLDWMDSSIRGAWKGPGSIIMVSRWSDLGNGKTRSETSYYMSSLSNTHAEVIQSYIRNHWDIENGCHWVLDTCRQVARECPVFVFIFDDRFCVKGLSL